MQRARTAALAAFGLVSVLALGACGHPGPDTAVSVSGSTVSVHDVNSLVDELNSNLRKAKLPAVPTNEYGGLRENVASMFAFTEVAEKYTREKGYPAPEVDYASMAKSTGLPQDSGYVKVAAKTQAYRDMLLSKAKPANLDEATLRSFFAELRDNHQIRDDMTFEQIRESLAQLAGLPEALGLRTELNSAIKRYHVSVNPLYGSVDSPLLVLRDSNSQPVPLVMLHVGGTGDPVVSPGASPLKPAFVEPQQSELPQNQQQ